MVFVFAITLWSLLGQGLDVRTERARSRTARCAPIPLINLDVVIGLAGLSLFLVVEAVRALRRPRAEEQPASA